MPDNTHTPVKRQKKTKGPDLPIILSDAIMVHPSFKTDRYRPLPWTTLTLPHEETSVDAAAQKVLRSIAGDEAMVPGELVEAVDGGDVVARHPAHLPRSVLHLAPFASLVVADDGHLLPWKRERG